MKETIRFKINGIQWKIKIVETDDESLEIKEGDYRAAITHYSEGTIYLQKEMLNEDESLLRTLLLHEIVHCYQMSYGMLQVMWDEEVVADFISVHIQSIMRTYYEIMVDINKTRTNGYIPKHMKENIGKIAEMAEYYREIDDWDNGLEIEDEYGHIPIID